jgi:uncharacterized protein YndB with AHSA1/START domain
VTTQNIIPGSTTTDQDFIISRIIDAEPACVFKAWTDPQQLGKWWGPRVFTSKCESDLRVGGTFRFTMVSPEDHEYPITGVYREIKEPSNLVWVQSCDEHPDDWHELVNQHRPKGAGNLNEMLVTTTFAEFEGKTKLTITMHFESATDRDALLKIGMQDGWSQSLDKLQELMAIDKSGNI